MMAGTERKTNINLIMIKLNYIENINAVLIIFKLNHFLYKSYFFLVCISESNTL